MQAFYRLIRLVRPYVLPQCGFIATLEVTLRALERVLHAVLHTDMRPEVTLHGTAVVTVVTLVGLLTRMDAHVSL